MYDPHPPPDVEPRPIPPAPPELMLGSLRAAQLVPLGVMKWLYESQLRLEPGLPASQMLPLAGGKMPDGQRDSRAGLGRPERTGRP